MTEAEWSTLAAVADALLPSIEREDDPGGFFARGAVALGTVARVKELVTSLPDPRDRARLRTLLSVLDSRLANLLLSGRFARLRELGPAEREALLRSWAFSRLESRRAGFQALKRLCHIAYLCWPPEGGRHPAWDANGYSGPLPMPPPSWSPLPTLEIEGDTTLDCDVVVLGSGAGGGVAAGVLAEAGLDVVVLENGPNPDPRAMTQIEGDMLQSLYLDGGMLMTQSGSMPILAGGCVGGGTVINYTTSFALPESVRDEWDRTSGLRLFTSARFAESLDRVSVRARVATEWSPPGRRDELLEQGLNALGWHVDRLPRNVTGCLAGAECGFCPYGCRHGAKNSTDRVYLRDATGRGARVICHCNADRVTTEAGQATGVLATVRQPDAEPSTLKVRARSVVVACGSIHTPAVLARSGISLPALGGNLHLHPVSAANGIFPDRVEPWTGALQTRYSDEFADLDEGYGVKFETAPVHFALAASAYGWESATRLRGDVARLSHTGVVGILLRDRHTGRVRVGRDGRPRVHYDVSEYDASHMRTGLRAAARVLAAAGATEILSLHTPPVRIRPVGDRWLDDWDRAADAHGFRRCRMSYVSFHQMGTARMGSDRSRSVAGETGEVHGLRNLYVADASAFPGSSGVNPMITIMAIADHVARGIADELK